MALLRASKVRGAFQKNLPILSQKRATFGHGARVTEQQTRSYQGGFGEGHESSPSPLHPSVADDDVLQEADVEVEIQWQDVAEGLFEENC